MTMVGSETLKVTAAPQERPHAQPPEVLIFSSPLGFLRGQGPRSNGNAANSIAPSEMVPPSAVVVIGGDPPRSRGLQWMDPDKSYTADWGAILFAVSVLLICLIVHCAAAHHHRRRQLRRRRQRPLQVAEERQKYIREYDAFVRASARTSATLSAPDGSSSELTLPPAEAEAGRHEDDDKHVQDAQEELAPNRSNSNDHPRDDETKEQRHQRQPLESSQGPPEDQDIDLEAPLSTPATASTTIVAAPPVDALVEDPSPEEQEVANSPLPTPPMTVAQPRRQQEREDEDEQGLRSSVLSRVWRRVVDMGNRSSLSRNEHNDSSSPASTDANSPSEASETPAMPQLPLLPLEEECSSSDGAARTSTTTTTTGGSCAICLEVYAVGEQVTWSSSPACPHAFHRTCLLDYAHCVLVERPLKQQQLSEASQESPTLTLVLCPLCREPFVSPNDNNENNYAMPVITTTATVATVAVLPTTTNTTTTTDATALHPNDNNENDDAMPVITTTTEATGLHPNDNDENDENDEAMPVITTTTAATVLPATTSSTTTATEATAPPTSPLSSLETPEETTLTHNVQEKNYSTVATTVAIAPEEAQEPPREL